LSGTDLPSPGRPSPGRPGPGRAALPVPPAVVDVPDTLREAFARAPALVTMFRGSDLTFVYGNPAHELVFGVRPVGVPAAAAFPDRADDGFLAVLAEVCRTGQPRLTEDTPVRLQPAPAGAPPLFLTTIYLPLADGGTVEGTLAIAFDVSGQVGERRGLRASTTRLAHSEREPRTAALTLQRSLLPRRDAPAGGLQVATRYQAGVRGIEVGGDWYDVIDLGAGRVAGVVGDVMGRGLRGAAVMGQVRAASRAYARLDLPPSRTIELLDGIVEEVTADATWGETWGELVTCAYVLYDPAGELVYALAGHPPPLLVQPDGSAAYLPASVGAPLGAGAAPITEQTVAVVPGSTVVMYTDGLVEQRRRDIDAGLEALREVVLTSTAHDLEALADEIIARMGGDEADDDIALLLLRIPADSGAPPARRAVIPVPARPHIVPHIRAFTARTLRRWETSEEVLEQAMFVVDELVANAIRHGGPPIELRLAERGGLVAVEVTDANGREPRQRRAGEDDESGRGLNIVAALSVRWGVRPTAGGKCVWAELGPAEPR